MNWPWRGTTCALVLSAQANEFFNSRSNNPSSTLREQVQSADGRGALGAGIDSTAQAAGQAINQTGALMDKLWGGQHDADQAKIRQKEDDVQISIAQQTFDLAKASKDRAQKKALDSLDTIKEVASRYAAIVDKM